MSNHAAICAADLHAESTLHPVVPAAQTSQPTGTGAVPPTPADNRTAPASDFPRDRFHADAVARRGRQCAATAPGLNAAGAALDIACAQFMRDFPARDKADARNCENSFRVGWMQRENQMLREEIARLKESGNG